MEKWKDIPGWEGLYQASDLGRIKSLSRDVPSGAGTRTLPERILKPGPDGHGYLKVGLGHKGKVTTIAIHRLVCLTWHGERPTPEHQAAHRDGSRTNNRAENLYWATVSENALDRVEHGTNPQAAQTHCTNGHRFTKANTYTSPQGWRRCRACARVRDAERRAA